MVDEQEDATEEDADVDVPSFRPVRFADAVKDLLAVKPDPEDKPRQADYRKKDKD